MMAAGCVLVRDQRVAAGGFETWVETLAEGLPASGVRTIVLAIGAIRELRASRVVAIDASGDDVEQARIVLRALESLAHDGEHGVFFSGGYPYIDIAALNLRQSPFAPVLVMHGRHPSAMEWIAAGPPRKIVVPAPDYARVVARELRRRARWFRAIGRVVTIPHGVPLPALGEKLTRPLSAPLAVAAVTRLDEDTKRPLDLIRIASRARERGVELLLTIAGGGPAEGAMRGAAPDNVVFAGVLSHERVLELLVASDVLLSTSESEAFGLAVAEALASGCAVVAADAPGAIREMVTPSTGARVPVGDIDAFVDALASRGDVRAKGAAGRKLIEQRFTVERMLRAYARLVHRTGSRARLSWTVPAKLLTSPSEATLPSIRERLFRWL
jgi:glycosyltransferase involved in cell wall biosynthesis